MSTKKNGFVHGHQRYTCKECAYQFTVKECVRRPLQRADKTLKKMVQQLQTMQQIAKEGKITIRTVQRDLKRISPPPVLTVLPKTKIVTLVADATFFGRKWCVLVFYDTLTRKPIAWRFCDGEKLSYYTELKEALEQKGVVIQAVTTDGRRGIKNVFKGIPYQKCLFHQIKTIRKYLTSRTRSDVGKELWAMTKELTRTSETEWTQKLDQWYTTHKVSFTKNSKIHSAYRSLRTNLRDLFTFERFPKLCIPTTTNHLDGGTFARLKEVIHRHRGMSRDGVSKMIDMFLRSK
jgi:hypothetical protein